MIKLDQILPEIERERDNKMLYFIHNYLHPFVSFLEKVSVYRFERKHHRYT